MKRWLLLLALGCAQCQWLLGIETDVPILGSGPSDSESDATDGDPSSFDQSSDPVAGPDSTTLNSGADGRPPEADGGVDASFDRSLADAPLADGNGDGSRAAPDDASSEGEPADGAIAGGSVPDAADTAEASPPQVSAVAFGYGTGCGSIDAGWSGRAMVGYDDGELYLRVYDTSATNTGPPTQTEIDRWTDDGGAHRLPRAMVTAIAINPCNFHEAVVASQGALPHQTKNDGTTWTEMSSFPMIEAWGLSYNPSNWGILYAVGPSGATATSLDDGIDWSMTPGSGDPVWGSLAASFGVDAGIQIASMAPFAFDQNAVVVATADGHVYMTQDGVRWNTLLPSHFASTPARTITHISANPIENPPYLYATYVGQTPDSVWMSANGGQGWTNITDNLPHDGSPNTGGYFGVSIDPAAMLPLNPRNLSVLNVAGAYGTGVTSNVLASSAPWVWTPAPAPAP